MELIHVNIDRPNGITGTDILFAASANGSLSFYVVGKVRQQFDYGIGCMPDRVWPLSIEEGERFVELPGHLWRPSGASVNMSSKISCMKMHGKHSDSDGLPRQHLMITSLGSEASGGSVYTLNLSEPLDYDLSSLMLRRRIYKAASFNCTVWTADCNSDGSQAVVGKFFTATFGKIVLCGLRNGAIVTVDTREKSEGLSARLARHQIPYASQGTCKPSSTTPRNLTKRCFELRGNISQSHITSMPSSISWLVVVGTSYLASLQLYDQCFLASSMDGSDLTWSHGFENERLTDGSHACSLFFEEGLTGNLVVKLVIIEDAVIVFLFAEAGSDVLLIDGHSFICRSGFMIIVSCRGGLSNFTREMSTPILAYSLELTHLRDFSCLVCFMLIYALSLRADLKIMSLYTTGCINLRTSKNARSKRKRQRLCVRPGTWFGSLAWIRRRAISCALVMNFEW
ncbi:hypothetical protein RHGRI_036999 [Rhododendron griersonianum]|uniref:Uncharacterized protein n=1 Tax=Rhododendron griersonianum TaxID=479676 RepID=A0AAV6HQL8_9ERIC|nr:hypothetical protein RHGRI_036999 [Rhododendron griersonianum]